MTLRSTALTAFVASMLLLGGCSKNPKRAIVGKWTPPGAPAPPPIEFLDDGTFTVDGKPGDLGFLKAGKYTFLSDGRLKEEAGDGSMIRLFTVAFENGNLKTTSDDTKKETIVYTPFKQ